MSPMNREDRRGFITRLTRTCLGVSFAAGAFGHDTQARADAPATVASKRGGHAKHVIYLFMDGAMSHLDTFDPKTGVEQAGQTRPIATKVAGMQFSDRFPKLAGLSDRLTVVRSLTTETGDHAGGKYLMRTAYKQLNSVRHPAMGAWMTDKLGRTNDALPANFLIGPGDRHPGAGFLSPSLSPVPISDPGKGLQNIRSPLYVSDPMFQRRLLLANRFDQSFQNRHKNSQVDAYNQLYSEAKQLMGSEELTVFDLKLESEAMRQAYGNSKIGQACLLARRLVQSGARFVEVADGGWDMHQDLYERLDEKAANLDQALAALLGDLAASGLLDETLVVLTTEFGRKPDINANAGRDHHPGAFCSLLAGAGIRTGQVYGSTDKTGTSVETDRVSVSDFNKTIAAAAGLPYQQEFFAPSGRPFEIGGSEGVPIEALLS